MSSDVTVTVTALPAPTITVTQQSPVTVTVSQLGSTGPRGLGWTGGSYNSGTGVVTFTSDDGLGFATDDLRAEGGGGSGTVTSVDVTGGTGIDSSGGPVTASGAITVALDAATQASLALADSALQSGDNISVLTNNAGYITDVTGDNLSALADVTITTIASGELLKWNGSAWVNNTIAEAGLATAAQGALADSALQSSDIGASVQAHSAVLDATTASFTTADETKLDGIEAGADVTDTANVTAAGALMDSEVTNLAQVKAFNSADYATAAQGTTADSAVQPGDDADTLGSGVATDGHVLTADGLGGAAWEAVPAGGSVEVLSNVATSTIIGRTTAGSGDSEELTAAQVRTLLNVEDGATADQTGAEIKTAYEAEANTNAFTDALLSKLNGIEALADVTDTTNVTAAGALMDSEVDADIKTLTLPANTTISTFGASLVDDADAATARTTLGLGTISTQAANSVSITGGSITGITDLAVADGGTGAGTAAGARTNLGLVIGTDVQAFDADTLKADTHDTLTAGFDSTVEALGTITTGTVTPEVDADTKENFKSLTNNGAFTLAPPSTSSDTVIRIHVTNGASAGTITTSGFDRVIDNDTYATTNAKEYWFIIDHNATRDTLTIVEIV